MNEEEVRSAVKDFTKEQLIDVIVKINQESEWYVKWEVESVKDRILEGKADRRLSMIGQASKESSNALTAIAFFLDRMKEKYGKADLKIGDLSQTEIAEYCRLGAAWHKKEESYQRLLREKDPYEIEREKESKDGKND